MNVSDITFFDDNYKHVSMNSIIEVLKFEPGPTFENTINKIKDNHLKNIASTAMNLSAITFSDDNFKQLSTNSIIEVETFESEPPFENTVNEIKDNHLKSITSAAMNLRSY